MKIILMVSDPWGIRHDSERTKTIKNNMQENEKKGTIF